MTNRDTATTFAVCLANAGNEASLEVGKLYEVIPDQEAVKHGYLHVIDESGEDYWHAADMFYLLELPRDLRTALAAAYQAA